MLSWSRLSQDFATRDVCAVINLACGIASASCQMKSASILNVVSPIGVLGILKRVSVRGRKRGLPRSRASDGLFRKERN